MKVFWKSLSVTISVILLILGIIAGMWLFKRAGEDKNFTIKDVINTTTESNSNSNSNSSTNDNPKPSIKSQIVMDGASTAISKATGTEVDVSSYVQNMEPADQAAVYELTESIGVTDVAKAAVDYTTSGTISQSTINSMTENLSDDEKAKLLELGLKYGNGLINQ